MKVSACWINEGELRPKMRVPCWLGTEIRQEDITGNSAGGGAGQRGQPAESHIPANLSALFIDPESKASLAYKRRTLLVSITRPPRIHRAS